MAKADIELLFGVAGGGSVSGASGAQIKGDLDAIVNAINAKPYDIKIQLDQQSITSFKNQLADLTKYAQDQAKAIKDAYNGIQFPTPPSPGNGGSSNPPGKKNGGRKTSSIIGADTSEMRKALATLSDYQLKVNNILKSSSAAKNGQGKELYNDLQDINDALKIYKGMIEQGGVSSAEFSQIMEYVSTTVKRANSEFKLLGENFNNDLIPKDSIGQLEGLTDIQKYRKQIKQMQKEWTAAVAPGAESAKAMSRLADEATQLKVLEENLRDGKAGADDLAKGLEHAGAVIKQVTAEVKYFGEDRSLIDFKPGAEANAQRIHELHAMMRSLGEIKILGVDDIHITQATIDSMSELLGSAEEVKAKIAELGKTEKVTFEAGIEFDGKTVEEIIAEASGDESNAVSVDVKLNINDEEIDVTLTTTEERLNALNKNWEAVLTGNTEDIEEKKAFVDTLLLDLEENVTTVTVDGYTYPAVDGLKGVSGWIDTVAKKNYQVVTVEYKTIGTPPQFAEGTKRAPEGPALLGDEYSPDGSPKPEMVITDGHAYIAGQSGPELVNLQEGDQVLTYDQTRKVLRGNPKVHKDAIPAFATGAGGFLAGSLAEQKYLEEQARIKREEEARAKAEAEAKAKAEAEAQKKAAQNSGSSAYWTNVKTYGTTDNRDTSAYYTSGTSSSKNNSTYTDGNPGGSLGSSGSGYGSGGGSGSSSSSSDSSSSSNEKSEFEKAYDYHQHLLAMEQEDYDDYLKWLERSYQEAYRTGQIELEDYLKYQEEVFNGQKELFQDGLSDIEHKIATLSRDSGNERQIINYYNQLISKIDGEIAAARARGLNDDDDYIQELLQQKWDYADEIADIQEEITENAKDAVDDLVDYRIDMLKQDLENEKDALSDKMSALKDFYDEQKQMLQDVRDEEKYLEEQSEKRKSVDDIRAEMDMLRFDDSAKSQKRLLELQEELREAEKELSDFEKDHALESTTDLLDKMYEQQESQIQSEIDELDARLNDPEALYNQALRDIQNNTLALYEEMVRYNAKYGSGNSQDITDMWNAADESLDAYLRTYGQAYKNIILSNLTGESTNGPKVPEIIHDSNNEPDNVAEAPVSDDISSDNNIVVTPNGNRYHLLGSSGSPFFNGSLSAFWKGEPGIHGQFMSHLFEGFANNFGNIKRTNQPTQITTGDIVIQGNADSKTVSEIRRAQRENVDYMLREFIKLNR